MSSKFNVAFRNWFGNSKVVNSQGKPLVVYHGTPYEFTEFRLLNSTLGIHAGTLQQAEDVNAKIIHSLYARIERPVRLADSGHWDFFTVTKELNKVGKEIYFDDFSRESMTELRQRMISELRIDGVVYLNRFEGLSTSDIRKKSRAPEKYEGLSDDDFADEFKSARDSWIALHPTQLKSADQNDGTWTIDDSDIRQNPRRRR